MEYLPSVICLLLCNVFTIIAQDFMDSGKVGVTSENDIDQHHASKQKMHSTSSLENHKPLFEKCNNYNASVKEMADRGTYVIQVEAVDRDPKDQRGGRLVYEIIQSPGTRANFYVNKTTGEIFTNTVFDRDEPVSQKEVYITVQATDDGNPKLADICAIKVTVLDINDCIPIFDQQEFHARVSADSSVNSEVMRVTAYDFDEGDNGRLTYSFVSDTSAEFNKYFKIDSDSGVVYLRQQLPANFQGKKFTSTVAVQDNGSIPNKITAELSITIVGSDKQQPYILDVQKEITVPENLMDFQTPLVEIKADSRIKNPSVAFELIRGKTTQTNKDQTFLISPTSDNSAALLLARQLDYETVTEFQLTVRVQNKDELGSSINIIIKVEDVNDEIPAFIELLKGSVVENDAPGVIAMTVRAVDKDGTAPFNVVRYELVSHNDLFEINPISGVIRTKMQFDREEENIYYVTVSAYDGAPSAILRGTTQPNAINQTFTITIEDINDNPPHFTNSVDGNHTILEGADILRTVVVVKAIDQDSASNITYSIIDGNIEDAFLIVPNTGVIKVNVKLDYEKIENYTLTIKADDGLFSDTAKVFIQILNKNDERPVFRPYNKNIYLREEYAPTECIIHLEAYDPDIKDRNADQKIVYSVVEKYKDSLDVDNTGCVRLIKKKDRDPPNGSPIYQGYISAVDNGGSDGLTFEAEITIVLEDINDNAPFLNTTEVIWYENEPSGVITVLTAIDYDSPENGPPFKYQMAETESSDVKDKFSVDGDILKALVTFDREARKFYDIRISITDNGTIPQTGESVIRVIIGDRNDNPAKDGSSEIFVYKYENSNLDIEIGRVYVDDPDDWDLNDKEFELLSSVSNFWLHPGGMIVMSRDTLPGQYNLNFEVIEEHEPIIPRHTVNADVNITVKGLPEEAVRKSGSLRFSGATIEEFVQKDVNGRSKKDILQERIAKIVNTSLENVDVFTVIPYNASYIDVRFSAHGSPYYAPENLNNKATEIQDELERELDVKFLMISINECLLANKCTDLTCHNRLEIKEEPAVVFTNKTSFVGVKAIDVADCDCPSRVVAECFNGGSPVDGGGCSCPEGFEGPHCEVLGIGFSGNGWAMYPSFDSCNNTAISLSFHAQAKDGLIFYAGPLTDRHAMLSKDFVSLELEDGQIVLKIGLSSNVEKVTSILKNLNDGAMHSIKITITSDDTQMEVDNCGSACLTWNGFKKHLLRINGPLLVGGRTKYFSDETAKTIWTNPPTSRGFLGCITNFTYNDYYYNLGAPSDKSNAHVNCNFGVAQAVTFGIDLNFLVAILVCIAILLILLLAVVVHKRKQDNLNEKDMDDTRENIINYEDEGGGECDTNFDLSVLRPPSDEKPPIRDSLYKQEADVPADIGSFLDNKKRACDKDNLPYDDVRHYGYEGDGNTSGSLSSLASCTDDGDLKFNYLSSFGPRFRKLADMYGDDGSDEGTDEIKL